MYGLEKMGREEAGRFGELKIGGRVRENDGLRSGGELVMMKSVHWYFKSNIDRDYRTSVKGLVLDWHLATDALILV